MKKIDEYILKEEYDKILELDEVSANLKTFIGEFIEYKKSNNSNNFTTGVNLLNLDQDELNVVKDINSLYDLGLDITNDNTDYDLFSLSKRIDLKTQEPKEEITRKKTWGYIFAVIGLALVILTCTTTKYIDKEVLASLVIIRLSLSMSILYIGVSKIIFNKVRIGLGLVCVVSGSLLISFILLYSSYDVTFFRAILIHLKNYICALFDYVVYDTYRSIGEFYG